MQLGTQWHATMGGCTGLRYEALYPLLDRQCSDLHDWQQTFADVRVLESAALAAMRDKD